MIQVKELVEIHIPCKNTLTEKEKTFPVMAYDFAHAEKILKMELDIQWIIGWMCF